MVNNSQNLKSIITRAQFRQTLLTAIFLIISQLSISQTRKLSAKVIYENSAVSKVDVINSATKKTTQTNSAGEFSIEVSVGQTLVFIADSFEFKKLLVSEITFKEKNLKIELFKKASALNEVTVQQVKLQHIGSNADFSNALQMQKQQFSSGIVNYGGSAISNGLNVINVFKKVAELFRGKSDTKSLESKLVFRNVAKQMLPLEFYWDNLKLDPDDLNLFFDYCEVDPESKVILLNPNKLAVMEFLIIKSDDFKKLPK